MPTPIKPSDDKYNYVFESWHKEITDATEDVVYKSQFKRVPKGNPSNPDTDNPGGNKPGDGDKPDTDNPGSSTPGSGTPGGNANADSTIPSTGDMAGPVGALFLLAGCIALAGVIVAAKKRKRNAK